ncbi:hypothetical protein K8T06_16330, partial [bacterium]|nr:hypothetical protein [bacterium]
EAGKKNHYGSDAFAWNFMGMLYDAVKEYNNAFICYRNALETYQSSYLTYYNLHVPHQLKIDLLNSASRTGLHKELETYIHRFKIDWTPPSRQDLSTGEIIVLWNNGLGPFKTEESINFFLDKGNIGIVNFVNQEHNFWLPVPSGGHDTNSFKDISFIRMALPQYHERKPLYYQASLTVGDETLPMESAQDINGIAILNLQDRMGRELASALLRLAIKQSIEHAVREEDPGLGAVVSIINAISEKADTRNWQTLPYAIYYARMRLSTGKHDIYFQRMTQSGDIYKTVSTIDLQSEQIKFMVFNDPQSATFSNQEKY